MLGHTLGWSQTIFYFQKENHIDSYDLSQKNIVKRVSFQITLLQKDNISETIEASTKMNTYFGFAVSEEANYQVKSRKSMRAKVKSSVDGTNELCNMRCKFGLINGKGLCKLLDHVDDVRANRTWTGCINSFHI